MVFAELVSDRAYVLEKGEIRWQGTMARSRLIRRCGAAISCCSFTSRIFRSWPRRPKLKVLPEAATASGYYAGRSGRLPAARGRDAAAHLDLHVADGRRATQPQFAALAKLLEVGVLARIISAG